MQRGRPRARTVSRLPVCTSPGRFSKIPDGGRDPGMRELRYSAPASLDEAVALLGDASQEPLVLAGGTDLLIQLRAGLRRSSHLVDLKRIPELNVLHVDAREGLRIGAAVPCSLLVEHDL